jgi:hypothetical protein
MKASLWLTAVLGAVFTASLAPAQYIAPALNTPLLPAPDACGPGFYCAGPCGCAYGPSYCLRPPFPPVSGVQPPPYWGGQCAQGQGGCVPPTAAFPTHPYARGPRDYFMWTEAERERITRERRPPFVP